MSKVIFTNNALRKIREDNLSQEIIYEVIRNGQRNFSQHEKGICQYKSTKNYGVVTVLAKDLNQGDRLVISCGLKKSYSNKDAPLDPRLKNASLFKKVIVHLLKMVGL